MVSSNFRVTPQILARRTTTNMQATLSSLQQIQAEVSSQKRIQKPSDDPVGMVASMRLRSDVDRTAQISRNIDDATAWLGTADNSLNSVVQQINKARDLAIQAQNGTLTQTERDSIANQIDDIRQNIIGLANTQYAGRSIFAGTVSGPAYDSSGNYLGNSVAVDRTVAPGTRVQVNVTGDDVFGPAGADLFTNLSTLSTQIRTGTSSTIGAKLRIDVTPAATSVSAAPCAAAGGVATTPIDTPWRRTTSASSSRSATAATCASASTSESAHPGTAATPATSAASKSMTCTPLGRSARSRPLR